MPHGRALAILYALRYRPFCLLLFDLGGYPVLSLQVPLELLYPVLYLLRCLVNLGQGKLVILFSFFVLKLKVASFAVLLQGLVLLPVLDTLLQPFFHETCVSSDFVDLGGSHFLEVTFTGLPFITIAHLSELVLPFLFIIELLQVSLHEDLLLRLVEDLQPLVEEGVSMLLEFLLRICQFHCWAVIAKGTSYLRNV